MKQLLLKCLWYIPTGLSGYRNNKLLHFCKDFAANCGDGRALSLFPKIKKII
ncbi:MAG: hypothetical protein K1X68_06430 [Saprospiraceae bacterium]|nr:hypothetical protein [Saprospiraceae bacterium]HMX88157.1 hypothetical protein [Saprospiraceae bacterium]HMZ39896.1 hypothetical protein [Saprospiraceae bacterium]HNC36187.1 hypothetical protein [Saprospiraceae bacterium]HNE62578.1 hypothetical protein [Saprospiraceae bacterium]